MDTSETTRLRALLERATQTPWEVTEIRDGRQPEGVEELGVFAPCDVRSYQKPDETWHGALICRGMDGPTRAANAALIVAAVNALPGLLDAAERAERAEARVRELEAIIAGRTTPPTDAEIAAHDGAWLVSGRGLALALSGQKAADCAYNARSAGAEWRWLPIADDGRPCAWPTAEVSR